MPADSINERGELIYLVFVYFKKGVQKQFF